MLKPQIIYSKQTAFTQMMSCHLRCINKHFSKSGSVPSVALAVAYCTVFPTHGELQHLTRCLEFEKSQFLTVI